MFRLATWRSNLPSFVVGEEAVCGIQTGVKIASPRNHTDLLFEGSASVSRKSDSGFSTFSFMSANIPSNRRRDLSCSTDGGLSGYRW